MASPAAITAIRAAHRGKFIAVQMCRTSPSVPGTAAYLHIINKIGTLGHFDLGFTNYNFGISRSAFGSSLDPKSNIRNPKFSKHQQ
jgi:hypothetical protein